MAEHFQFMSAMIHDVKILGINLCDNKYELATFRSLRRSWETLKLAPRLS